jgi:CheY-like chemotaxis protein
MRRYARDAGKAVTPLILIVEDSSETAEILARLLTQRGIAAVVMSGSKESFGYLGSAYRSDLVILDMKIPAMDGLDCLSAIRANVQWNDIPVLMYSADSKPGQSAAARRLGAQEFINKSWSWEEFLGTIRKYASSAVQQAGENDVCNFAG